MNDGISLFAVADAAVSSFVNITTRLKELAEQSASGSISDRQRLALDKEATALTEEYSRIINTTAFNGQKLFDGSAGQGTRLQLGFGDAGSLLTKIGGERGTGSFTATQSINQIGSNGEFSASGDINGDGILDIVTNDDSGTLSTYFGNGNGTFTANASYALLEKGVTLADVNGDGFLDALGLTGSGSQGFVTISLNKGDGTFSAAKSYLSNGTFSQNVVAADLNNDGIIDLVTAGKEHVGPINGIAVLLGLGGGQFAAPTAYTNSDTSILGTQALGIGDLNGDGFADIISVGLQGRNTVATIRLGTGSGTFGASITQTIPLGDPFNLKLKDLNGDANLDLIYSGDDSTYILLGNGTGTFNTATSYATGFTSGRTVEIADFNGDGLDDLATQVLLLEETLRSQ